MSFVQTSPLTTGFTIIDDDNNDTSTFTLDCGTSTGYFIIDPSTGAISFSGVYDVDSGVAPTSVSCTVQVSDSGGLTDNVTMDITISEFRYECTKFFVT